MAVYRMDTDRGPEKVDLSARQASPYFRSAKALIYIGLVVGSVYFAFTYLVSPMFFNGKTVSELVKGLFPPPPVDQIDPRIPAREQLQGKDLLLAELKDPLPDELHKAYVSRALKALPDQVQALVDAAAAEQDVDLRAHAYQTWVELGLNEDDDARLRLLRALVDHDRDEDKVDRTTRDLLANLRAKPPADAALFAALPWAKRGVFAALVDLLAQPAPSKDVARRRSEELARHLDRDTKDLIVLNAMIRTGFAPRDAAARLVQGRGLEWARSDEGKAQLTRFISENPDSITPLLQHDDEEHRLFAVDLLVASGTPAAVDVLTTRALRDTSLRVRLRTTIGLGAIQDADAAWPLALCLARRDPAPEAAFEQEIRQAIARFPVDQCVARFREHLAANLPVGDRYWAVVGLGAVQNAGGLPALVEALRDPDPVVRRKAISVCEDLQRAGSNLSSALAQFREVARTDGDAAVRQGAARVYKGISGHDP
jgi:hypothetical protein